jgi:hypothetical protein
MDGDLNAEAEEDRAGEELRDVSRTSDPEAVQRQAGRSRSVPPAALLREAVLADSVSEGGPDSRRLPEAGSADAEDGVRDVRSDDAALDPPRRSELAEQRTREPQDAVRVLPHYLASCARGDREAALANHADRLRCLGNAVVPAQAELAFRVLLERAMNQATLELTAVGTRIEGTDV